MSATKNKAIDKLNEPAKPTAARKKAIKKAVAEVVERQAVEVAPAEVITVTAEPIITTPAEPIKETPAVNIEPTEPTPTLKQKAAALWQKWGWAVMAFMVVLLALLIYDWVHVVQINKQLRQTPQVESKVADEKANLGQTEANLSQMQHKRVDSLYQITKEQYEKAQDIYEAYHATMDQQNEVLKKQNDAIQDRIRLANDDTLRRIGSELSGR